MQLFNKKSNWSKVSLSEIAEIGAGNSAPQGKRYFEDGIYPFVRTADVGKVHWSRNLVHTKDKINDLALQKMRLKLWPKKTILFPKSGASVFLNHRAITGMDAYIASHLATIVADTNKIIPEFLYYNLLNIDSRHIIPDTDYPSVRLTDIAKIRITVPPLNEQKRIVETLNNIDDMKQKKQSACSTMLNLIHDIYLSLFGDPIDNPKKWDIKKIGDLLEYSDYGISQALLAQSRPQDGPPVLRIANVTREGYLDYSDLRYHKVSPGVMKKLTLLRGDLLFNWRNSPNLVGKTAIFDQSDRYIFASFLFRMRVNVNKISNYYLWALLNILRKRDFFITKGRQAVSQSNFNGTELQQVYIPVAPLDMQKKFDNLIQKVESIRRKQFKTAQEINTLFESLTKRI